MARVAMVLTTLLAVVSLASAGERAGVKMADTVNVGGETLTLNGMGLREATVLKVDVYVAGLYLEHVSSNPQQILASNETKVIVLKFKRDVGRDDIVKAWREGFEKNAPVPKPLVDQLAQWMPSFRKGDVLMFTLMPGKGVAVDINGKRKGVLGDDNFSRSLLSIWLGPNPPTGSLKTGMLGKHAQPQRAQRT